MIGRLLLVLSAAALFGGLAAGPPGEGRGLTADESWATCGGDIDKCCGTADKCTKSGEPLDSSAAGDEDGSCATRFDDTGGADDGGECGASWTVNLSDENTCIDGPEGADCSNGSERVHCSNEFVCHLTNDGNGCSRTKERNFIYPCYETTSDPCLIVVDPVAL